VRDPNNEREISAASEAVQCGAAQNAHPRRALLHILRPDNLVLLHERDLWHAPDLLDHLFRELSSVARDMALVDLLHARHVVGERVSGVCRLQEVHVVLHDDSWDIILKHDDVRVVDAAMGMLDSDKRGETQGCVGDVDIGAG
jgi:hypothetical protein